MTTPYLFPAKQFGVSIVIHSTSKYITGNGSTIGGVLVDLGNYDWRNSPSEPVREMVHKAGDFAFLARTRKQILQNTGGCLSPFNAYLQNLGLETLALRMGKHFDNALALAKYLGGFNNLFHLFRGGTIGRRCLPGSAPGLRGDREY